MITFISIYQSIFIFIHVHYPFELGINLVRTTTPQVSYTHAAAFYYYGLLVASYLPSYIIQGLRECLLPIWFQLQSFTILIINHIQLFQLVCGDNKLKHHAIT